MLPEGWSIEDKSYPQQKYVHGVERREQKEAPKGSSPVGIIALAAAIKNNGAMLMSVNILNNNNNYYFATKQAQNLVAILKEHATLKSLCGNKGDETELDMSDKKMGPEGAMMLAPEIVANRALTSLNVSNNGLGKYWDTQWISDMTGVKALAAAIPKCK